MLKSSFQLKSPPEAPYVGRRYGVGKARFLDDVSGQLDPIYGCPEMMVPADHLARRVRDMVKVIDTSEVEKAYSSLGRRSVHPRRVLAVLVYASLIDIHHASKVARLTKTDAAFRLLSGGYSLSATKLRTFRRESGDFLEYANEQVIRLAFERGLLDLEDLATDAVRLRAHASTKSIRTVKRSKERLAELEGTDVSSLDEVQRAEREAKLAKHREALQRCEREERTNISVTNPSAGLMKFPSGATLPGHRVTVTACGTGLRFVVGVLIGSEPTDGCWAQR